MPHQPTTWHGTGSEALTLLHALAAHCECLTRAERIVAPCAAHLMLAQDQRAIDGLLFMRRFAARLLFEEFQVAEPPVDDERGSALETIIPA